MIQTAFSMLYSVLPGAIMAYVSFLVLATPATRHSLSPWHLLTFVSGFTAAQGLQMIVYAGSGLYSSTGAALIGGLVIIIAGFAGLLVARPRGNQTTRTGQPRYYTFLWLAAGVATAALTYWNLHLVWSIIQKIFG